MDEKDALRHLRAAIARSGDDAAVEALSLLERELEAARERPASVADVMRAILRSPDAHSLVSSHDVGERERAEQALARSEASFRTLIESLQDCVLVHREGRVVYINPAATAGLGYTPAEIIGRPVTDFITADHQRTVLERLAKVREQGVAVPPLEGRILRKDGSLVTVEAVTMPTLFDGEPALITLGRDVTLRKQMEAQLIMADRLASIGRLAASVGHEINNPLAYVLGTISLLRHDVDGGALPPALAQRMTERLEILRDGAERMRNIVRELKTLARADDVIDEPVDIARVLDVCTDMAAHEIRHRARLTKRYGPGLFAPGGEARLGQVFLNLLVNAGQAIPEGAAGDHEVRVNAFRTGDRRIAVEVRDTGAGIRPEDRERIFEPFFTTKPPGTSSGLGLSICHHIVTSLGGTIEVRANESGGTTLLVVLPAANAPSDAPRDEPSSAPRNASGRVLVVDDEPAVAEICAAQLAGYEVVLANSGRGAIELLERGERFDAIVCDLLMGDGTGADVYDYVREHFPGLEHSIVLMTGGASTRATQAFLARLDNVRLEKPFSAHALRDAVATAIASRAKPT